MWPRDENVTEMNGKRCILVATLGVLVSLPYWVLMKALAGDPELPDAGFILLFLPPAVHFILSLVLGWWNWRFALIFAISMYFTILLGASLVEPSVGWVLSGIVFAGMFLIAWALGRSVRWLVRSGYL